MATLKFVDSYNMVAFLSKPAESEGFEQIVDFLNAHPIRSLQLADAEGIDCFLNSTIFENLAFMGYEKISEKLTFYKAFFSPQWKFIIHTILQCLSPKTTAWNEFSSIMASAIICLATNHKFNFSKLIFDSMVRNLDNLSGEFLMYPSLEAEQDNGNIDKTQSKATLSEPSFPGTSSGSGPRCQETMGDTIAQTRFENVSTQSYDPLLARGNTLRSGEDSPKLKELMKLCTNLQQRVLDLEKTKTTQPEEIVSLKRRVTKLEQEKRSRTHKLKRLRKGRIDDIDADDDITLVSVHDVNVSAGKEEVVEVINTAKLIIDAAQVSVVGDKVSTADAATTVSVATTTTSITVEEITLAQALADLKSTKPKAKGVILESLVIST
ncbi:hypothetical protein Tco_1424011 [Tanacetum coccineum]